MLAMICGLGLMPILPRPHRGATLLFDLTDAPQEAGYPGYRHDILYLTVRSIAYLGERSEETPTPGVVW